MILEQRLQNELLALQTKCNGLERECALRHALQQLIDDIMLFNTRWNEAESKTISYSFFDNISNKLTGQERLVPQSELIDICQMTNWLLCGTMKVDSYNHFANGLFEGKASFAMTALGIAMLFVGTLALISSILTPGFGLAALTVASLVVGAVFYKNSGATGLAKDANKLSQAYEEYASQLQAP